MLLQVAEQILRLLAAQLGLLDDRAQARRGHETPLAPAGENSLQLLDLDHRVRDHRTLTLLPQPGPP